MGKKPLKDSLKGMLSQFRPTLIHDPAPFIQPAHRVMYGTFAAIVASSIVHPLDLIKTRLQISPFPFSTMQMARRIMRFEGYRSFYNGFTATIYRQVVTTGSRLMCYNYLYEKFKTKYKRRPSKTEKVKLGMVAGTIGAFMGNPTEVVLVRMMASSAPRAYNKCPDLQNLIDKRYTCFPDAIQRIITEEGVTALWRGGSLTIIRSLLNSGSQIGAYAMFRDYFLKHHVSEGYFLHVISAMMSSFVFTVISMPVDHVKTRYQLRRYGVTKTQIFRNTVRLRGLSYFWKKPLLSYYVRITLHTLISFFVLEAIENRYDEEEKEWAKKGKF